MSTRAGHHHLEQTFAGASEMARRMREHDWDATPLGPPSRWPQSLRTAVRIMLTSRFAMWMGWGPQLTFMYNEAYARMTLGAKHPWALGRRADEVWHEIWPDIGPLITQVLETGEATWSEGLMLLLERSGYPEETYHTFSYSPLADDRGAIAGMFCVVTEETDRIIGERRLARLADMSARIAAVRTESDVLDAAQATLHGSNKDLPFALLCLMGESAELVTARTAGFHETNSITPASDPQFWHPLVNARPSVRTVITLDEHSSEPFPTGAWSKPPTKAALVPIAAQGEAKPVGYLLAGLNPHRDFDATYGSFLDLLAGQVSAGLGSARAYEEERRRAAALAEIDRAKTLFFSNVSHEFRTPLALMMSPLDDVLGRPGDRLDPDDRVLLEVAQRNAARLLKLVNTLLDFTRIEAGRAQASFEPVDLAAFSAELASNFRPAMEKAALELVLDCRAGSQPVHVDRNMWEKVVLNLLSNAFKFTFAGKIEVKTAASVDGKSFMLSVRDTGVGIPASERSRVFERFHRIEGQRSRSFEGSGIGLALVQEIVKLHGGTIDVESEVGEGTTFTITLPVGTTHLPAAQIGAGKHDVATSLRADVFVDEALRWLPSADAPADGIMAEDRSTTGRTSENRSRILIADDNADMRGYIERLLGARWEVLTVGDGEAALAAAATWSPNLVLADVMMPKLDGFELVKRLRADPKLRALPILLLSARAGEEARIEGLARGADDYLVKPFSARELVARIDANLRLAEIRQEGEDRITAVLDSVVDGFHVVDASLRFTAYNAAARRMFAAQGLDFANLIGKHVFDDVFPQGSESAGGEALLQAAREKRPTAAESYWAPWQRWFDVRHAPTPDGGVATFFQDITERKRADEQQRLLTNELNHRVRNTLAVIQSIASQTLRETPDPKAFKTAFSHRLLALARAHNLLTRKEWRGADLKDIADGALAAFQGDSNAHRVRIRGPSVLVTPDAAVSMSLVLHELATNAAKYGALSNADGYVEFAWTVGPSKTSADGEWLDIRWVERNGPTVSAPSRRGFGRRVIEASAEQLSGRIAMEFPASGVECTIELPLTRNSHPVTAAASPPSTLWP